MVGNSAKVVPDTAGLSGLQVNRTTWGHQHHVGDFPRAWGFLGNERADSIGKAALGFQRTWQSHCSTDELMLLPREHGMYAQMALPLITSPLVAGASEASLLLTVAVVAGFVTHEPLLVLVGRRGPRAKLRVRTQARVCLAIGTTLTLAAGILAVWWSAPAVRWAFFLPLLPAMFACAAVAAGREKTLPGELAAALAFALVAAPLILAAGAAPGSALAVAMAFAVVFTAGTLAVRAVILRVRRGGNRHAVRSTRRATLTLSVAVVAALSMAAARGDLSPAPLFAITPTLLVASTISLLPVDPGHLRAIGWALVAATTITAAILVAML